jgi:cytochrome bd ubiquinol oxidase subunit II
VTLADAVLAVLWVGLTTYAVFGGADFGAGVWDLLAGRMSKGMAERDFIEHSIAPVWEANHVWLIFVLVVLWTGFPPAFAAVASTLYIPLTLAALGMIARGSAFAFRKSIEPVAARRLFGATFALSSLLTPFFLGCVAGGVASGRVPPGIARGNVLTSWLNPTSVLGGALAVGTCAYLAAVFLSGDASREGLPAMADHFRTRALQTAVVDGAMAAVGVFVLRADAPRLFDGLLGRGIPAMLVSGAAGLASILLLVRRRHVLARVTAVLAVAGVVWGWALAQYPYLLLPDLTIPQAAASPATLRALTYVLVSGAVLLVPALVFLYALFQRSEPDGETTPA